MDFGYFTLSDNHYENNKRTPNQFVMDILNEALYADELADVVIYALEFANITGLDLASAIEAKMAAVAAQGKAKP